PECHANLGLVYLDLHRVSDARACFERAVELRPNWAGVYATLASILWELGHVTEARARFEQALALDPEMAEAHMGLGLIMLCVGEYEVGWTEHEWRWRCKGFRSWPRHTQSPRWSGEALLGRRLLLWAEQGL